MLKSSNGIQTAFSKKEINSTTSEPSTTRITTSHRSSSVALASVRERAAIAVCAYAAAAVAAVGAPMSGLWVSLGHGFGKVMSFRGMVASGGTEDRHITGCGVLRGFYSAM